jgi:hypothetical protein
MQAQKITENAGEFVVLLQGVHDFYGKDMSEFALGVWVQACQAFTLEQVSKAFTAHTMDAERGAFMPKPSDIVRALYGTVTDRSLVAWGKVMDAVRLVGAYSSVAFDDPAIHCAVEDMGGWPKVCREPLDALPHTQRRFCDAHRAYTTRGTSEYPRYLPGVHELENRAGGHRVAPPVLIGNPESAQQVLRLGGDGKKTQVTHLVGSSAALRIGRAREAA